MGVIIRWRLPDTTEVTYDKTYIYRSSSETGTYTELSNQLIADNTYFDIDGDTSSWYKIRFYKSTVTATWSAWSDPLQGGNTIGYCIPGDVRNITNISSSDLTDTEIYDVIQLATAELNSAINCRTYRERLWFIDNTRKNTIDGVNKTYYVKNFKGKFLADYNNDAIVDVNDLIVYAVDTIGNQTIVAVKSIDSTNCSFTLTTAVSSGYSLYVTYCWSYIAQEIPNKLLKLACTLLTSAYCYAKINFGRAPNVSFGNLKIYRHMDAFDKFYKMYQNVVDKINSKQADYSDCIVTANQYIPWMIV
jgi:hypothetical protein